MIDLLIREADFEGADKERAARLHAFLKESLAFPDYYGANLSALDDCLGDLCEPARITVEFSGADAYDGYREWAAGAGGTPPWLGRFAKVLERAARENPYLETVITHV